MRKLLLVCLTLGLGQARADEPFRDRFQRFVKLAPGTVEFLGQKLFGRNVAGGP